MNSVEKDLELVKFTLTSNMSLELIKFDKLKKELLELKELYNLDKNEELLLKINQLEYDLNESRNKFIKEFRIINKKEIEEYIKIKDQI